MQFIWRKEGATLPNHTLAFCLCREDVRHGELRLYAADIYRVFVDGRLLSYGPERTAAGYARERRIATGNARNIVVEVMAYNIACYNVAFGRPFFGAELYDGGRLVAQTEDFSCRLITDRLRKVQRLSYQRGFVEYYRQSFDKQRFYNGDFSLYPEEETASVPAPALLEGNVDTASYRRIGMHLLREGSARVNGELPVPARYIWWETFADEDKMDGYPSAELEADLVRELSQTECFCEGEMSCRLYGMDRIRTGLIGIEAEAEEPCTLYAVFDGIAEGEEGAKDAVFCRPVFHNAAAWRLQPGKYSLLTFEPYDFMYLKLIAAGKAKVREVYITEIANKEASASLRGAEKELCAVFDAGKSSFSQNAVDIFTDCPGRERAGWLCDSYFSAKAEQLLTGKSSIEGHFLENFLLAREENLPEGMLPMCYPARQRDGTYIPNWAMWFVVELRDYYQRTGDDALKGRAKDTVYGLILYFEQYSDEEGLLEDLPGWVFVEWSAANEYTAGVNFPSNMLYAYMLEAAAELYADESLCARARQIKKQVAALSFDGTFFTDNALRSSDGRLARTENRSETCQYYALFCGVPCSDAFKKRMLEEFGPERAEGCYADVRKSNAFIGNYLRLLWLLSEDEGIRARRECTDYFYYMAQRTGTLWEYQSTEASCNHGFTSVICAVIAEFLFGYRGFSAKYGAAYFSGAFAADTEAELTVPVGDGELHILLRDGRREIRNRSSCRVVVL